MLASIVYNVHTWTLVIVPLATLIWTPSPTAGRALKAFRNPNEGITRSAKFSTGLYAYGDRHQAAGTHLPQISGY